MLSESDRSKAADLLMVAERERKQTEQLSKLWPDIGFADAYEISAEVNRRKIDAGARLIGMKVGLTSKAMQRSSQIDEPDFGYLLDSMLIADGAATEHDRYCLPRVELELAFIMGKTLSGHRCTLFDALAATEYVSPALEIVDARIKDKRTIFDTISDNGASAGIVLGGRPIRPMDIDLRWAGGILYQNGVIEETGLGAGVLGHPALAIAWLANKMAEQNLELKPGHIVLSGSFTKVVFPKKGDVVHGDFGPLGGVSVRFV